MRPSLDLSGHLTDIMRENEVVEGPELCRMEEAGIW